MVSRTIYKPVPKGSSPNSNWCYSKSKPTLQHHLYVHRLHPSQTIPPSTDPNPLKTQKLTLISAPGLTCPHRPLGNLRLYAPRSRNVNSGPSVVPYPDMIVPFPRSTLVLNFSTTLLSIVSPPVRSTLLRTTRVLVFFQFKLCICMRLNS